MPPSGVVTVLFTDFVGSTGLIDRLGADAAHDQMQRHLATMRRCLTEHGGREVKTLGDGVMSAFGSAYDALVCAAAMQRAAKDADGPRTLRVGVHAGEVLQHAGDLHGEAVVIARRLCDAAAGGEVLVSDLVRGLIGGRGSLVFDARGPLALKGFERAVDAAALDWRQLATSSRGAPSRSGGLPIRLVLVDDEDLVRRGLRLILETEESVEVVGEADSGDRVLELIETLDPDVLLMDIRMPGPDGLETCRALAERGVRTRVIILTTFGHDENVYGALRAGASGFLLKSAPTDELLMAIRAVHRGDAMLQPSVTRRMIEQFAQGPRFHAPPDEIFGELTARELDIVRLLARGLSNGEIAEELVISETTVKSHVAAVLMKLRLRDRIQVVVLAYESGFVTAS